MHEIPAAPVIKGEIDVTSSASQPESVQPELRAEVHESSKSDVFEDIGLVEPGDAVATSAAINAARARRKTDN
jgi:hypothetical protein